MEQAVELNFTDITMSETDGIFSEVEKKMLGEFPYDNKWMIRTDLTIVSPTGIGEMILHCFHDGNILIVDYNPSMGDVFYNPDIQAISQWAQEGGWKIPQPGIDLIKQHREFWKHFYDTLVIDSKYFDNLYGIRPQLENENESEK